VSAIIYITFISLFFALLFLARLYLLKKEMNNAARQLSEWLNNKTDKKINISLLDKDFERLVATTNDLIDYAKQVRAEKKKTENELKRAVANMSHDIRTPLTSILGYIQLMETDEVPIEKRKEYTLIAKERALRLKELLDNFFELSIVEGEDYQLKTEKIKLNHLLIEILFGFYEQFRHCQIEPTIHVPDQEIIIYADASAVKRVIENLVHNAIKYSSGNVTIRLEMLPSAAHLIISNSVQELSENDIPYLFDRFYKLDKSRSEKGAGLGLSIAKTLMLKMNGNLTAKLEDKELSMICEWKI